MTERHDSAEPSATLIGAGEVARLLGVSTRTVKRYQKAGRLSPAITLPSGHHRYRRADVDALATPASVSQ